MRDVAIGLLILALAICIAIGLGASVHAQVEQWPGEPDTWYRCYVIDSAGPGETASSSIDFEQRCSPIAFDAVGDGSEYIWLGREINVVAHACNTAAGCSGYLDTAYRQRIVPPRAIEQFTVECDVSWEHNGPMSSNTTATTGGNINATGPHVSHTGFTHVFTEHGPAASYFNVGWSWNYPGDSMPWGNTANPLTSTTWPYVRARAFVLESSTLTRWVTVYNQCTIVDWTVVTGWTYELPPANIRTPPPSPGFPTSEGWVPVGNWISTTIPIWSATPAPYAIGVSPTPTSSDCYDLIPDFGEFGGWTLFSYSVPTVTIPSLSTCINEYDVSIEMYDWDFVSFATPLALLLAVGAIYSVLRRS